MARLISLAEPILLGILFGLLAAFFQSLSYLATRHFVQRRGEGASRMLLVLAHVWMGVWACLMLPFIWPRGGIPWAAVAWPLAGTSLFYLLGQIGLMIALKHTEPSRVSPLLGFKIVILAAMTVTLPTAAGGGQALSLMQWAAVFICLIAALSLNYSGARLGPAAIFGVMMACVAYSLSDWHIGLLVAAVKSATGYPQAWAPVLATCLCYASCGVIAIALLPVAGLARGRVARDFRGAIPFGAAWFVAMLCLFACFGLAGVVFGNILQSTRGVMSVVLGSLLLRYGMLHLEPTSARGVLAKRLAAATLMLAAVTLFKLG